jgi:predicted acylesterase/phospholipase RssA
MNKVQTLNLETLPSSIGPVENEPGVEGCDGVCFTAGAKAAIVGAGTVHAYLASRRAAPKVVAGISLGALNAAAMQRVYRDLHEANASPSATTASRDAARWRWFRNYLDVLSRRPFDVLWRAIPDQSDFFADMIPIKDPATPKAQADEEREARRVLYLKVKLGRWLARLPLTGRVVASSAINFVRFKEKYPLPQRAWSGAALVFNIVWCLFVVAFRVGVSPHLFPEHLFRPAEALGLAGGGPRRRLLFGWLNLIAATAGAAVLVITAVSVVLLVTPLRSQVEFWHTYWPAAALGGVVLLVYGITARFRQRLMRSTLVQTIAGPVLITAAYLYSVINLLMALIIMLSFGQLALGAVWQKDVSGPGTRLGIAVALWLLAAIPWFLTVLVPEMRRKLVEHGLLEEWPRPLFGWGIFVGCWINLLGVAGSILLGWSFVLSAATTAGAGQALAPMLLAFLIVPIVPIAPVMPTLALSVIAWQPLQRFATARRGPLVRVGVTLTIVLVVGEFAAAAYLLSQTLVFFEHRLWPQDIPLSGLWMAFAWPVYQAGALALMSTWFVMVSLIGHPLLRRWFIAATLEHVGLKGGLIPDLHLKLALIKLFESEMDAMVGVERASLDAGPGAPTAVVVSSPLQSLRQSGKTRTADQFWAKPTTPLVHALRAAMAAPPLFQPVRVTGGELEHWLNSGVRDEPQNWKQLLKGVDLVDGTAIRHNPLPALFGFFRTRPDLSDEIARRNDREHPALHVVYGVPTEGSRAVSETAGVPDTIVDVGLASLRLSRRRDTQLEVIQTNVIAQLETCVPAAHRGNTQPIFADEIAPESDIVFSNQLNPGRAEVLVGVASGCRRSLERLYARDLPTVAGAADGQVSCVSAMRQLGRWAPKGDERPGLPEVCGACTAQLKVSGVQDEMGSATARIHSVLGSPKDLAATHPQLTGEEPRAVVVTSGGVFRGAFHIGLLAGLREIGLKPDLIVGASVGTLMGGALGSMYCRPDGGVIEELLDVFMNVDERVALTHTLKNAARELGLRGRSVKLSPNRIRRLVRAGATRDPGFAATGAPSAMIDALSDLFLIPHGCTREVASAFVAGDVTGAVKGLLVQLKTETVRRLDIERAVLGTSLLETVAVSLLSNGLPAERLQRQPYQPAGIAFYGTATNLLTQSATLLGGAGTHPDAPFDFVEACLASSAFPAVFAPRAESRVFPGTGHPDVLLADGGMFDNLPFMPAIEILSKTQRGYRAGSGAHLTCGDLLRRRLSHPDLFIVGALDPRLEDDAATPWTYDSMLDVRDRVGTLRHNVKIRAFELASQRIDDQLSRLAKAAPDWLSSTEPHFVDRVVNGGVLAIFPSSKAHLNGTFAFSASMGLRPKRVQKSVADGCYQTLLAFATQQARSRTQDLSGDGRVLTARSVAAVTKSKALPIVEQRLRAGQRKEECPFFSKDGKGFVCPFVQAGVARSRKQMRGVFDHCTHDHSHG